jgi:starch synthase
MLFTIQHAVALYHDAPASFKMLVRNAYNSHFDWKQSADTYLSYYNKLME